MDLLDIGFIVLSIILVVEGAIVIGVSIYSIIKAIKEGKKDG